MMIKEIEVDKGEERERELIEGPLMRSKRFLFWECQLAFFCLLFPLLVYDKKRYTLYIVLMMLLTILGYREKRIRGMNDDQRD